MKKITQTVLFLFLAFSVFAQQKPKFNKMSDNLYLSAFHIEKDSIYRNAKVLIFNTSAISTKYDSGLLCHVATDSSSISSVIICGIKDIPLNDFKAIKTEELHNLFQSNIAKKQTAISIIDEDKTLFYSEFKWDLR